MQVWVAQATHTDQPLGNAIGYTCVRCPVDGGDISAKSLHTSHFKEGAERNKGYLGTHQPDLSYWWHMELAESQHRHAAVDDG